MKYEPLFSVCVNHVFALCYFLCSLGEKGQRRFIPTYKAKELHNKVPNLYFYGFTKNYT
jgi:hypothetical protein